MNKMDKNEKLMEVRIQYLLHNGLTSKSGMTIATTEVLKAIAIRLGYDIKTLKGISSIEFERLYEVANES